MKDMEDNTKWKMTWTLIGVGIAILLTCVLTLQSVLSIWAIGNSEDAPSPEYFAEVMVDAVVEAGWLDLQTGVDDHLLEDRTILVTHAINEHTATQVTARLLALNAQDSDTEIDLYLSSPGGWVGSAFMMIDAMERIEAPVNAHVLGGCSSSCALILASATGRRTATRNSILMVHANRADSTEPYTFAQIALERYERVWKENSSVPEEWFPMTDDEAYYLTPDEALKYGIIDEILVSGE